MSEYIFRVAEKNYKVRFEPASIEEQSNVKYAVTKTKTEGVKGIIQFGLRGKVSVCDIKS